MNNKCNLCAKFLTCNRQKCKKITFLESKILEKPKTIINKDWEQQALKMANEMRKVGITLEEYLKKLNKNKREIEDRLIIGYDQSNKKDHTCLLVSRKRRDGLTVINEFFDEEAEEIYNKLTKHQYMD